MYDKPHIHKNSDPDRDWLRLHELHGGFWIQICSHVNHLSSYIHVDCDPDLNLDSGPGAFVNTPVLSYNGSSCLPLQFHPQVLLYPLQQAVLYVTTDRYEVLEFCLYRDNH